MSFIVMGNLLRLMNTANLFNNMVGYHHDLVVGKNNIQIDMKLYNDLLWLVPQEGGGGDLQTRFSPIIFSDHSAM